MKLYSNRNLWLLPSLPRAYDRKKLQLVSCANKCVTVTASFRSLTSDTSHCLHLTESINSMRSAQKSLLSDVPSGTSTVWLKTVATAEKWRLGRFSHNEASISFFNFMQYTRLVVVFDEWSIPTTTCTIYIYIYACSRSAAAACPLKKVKSLTISSMINTLEKGTWQISNQQSIRWHGNAERRQYPLRASSGRHETSIRRGGFLTRPQPSHSRVQKGTHTIYATTTTTSEPSRLQHVNCISTRTDSRGVLRDESRWRTSLYGIVPSEQYRCRRSFGALTVRRKFQQQISQERVAIDGHKNTT